MDSTVKRCKKELSTRDIQASWLWHPARPVLEADLIVEDYGSDDEVGQGRRSLRTKGAIKLGPETISWLESPLALLEDRMNNKLGANTSYTISCSTPGWYMEHKPF